MLKSSKDTAFMIRVLFEWIVLDMLIAYVFYKSLPAFFILMPGVIVYVRYRYRMYLADKKALLSLQFRESILAVSTSLNAGYSVENAFIEAYHDMRKMYGEEAPITREYHRMVLRLRDNEQIEDLIRDFARRSEIEDISDFAGVFEAAKRIGGDMTAIIKRAAANISEKIEVKREIETSMSSRKLELKIMIAVPFFILLYLQVSSGEFVSVLYHNLTGQMIMTAALILYLCGILTAVKIVNIEV